ncbi:MAG: hypothetical protein KBE22_03300 [Candidatus Accumulibacter sp.]|nr:hypothetical protein [Accumulibacter sp.]
MTIRFNSTGKMEQTPNGEYVTYAEHERLVHNLMGAASLCFQEIEIGELNASEAEDTLKVTISLA